MGWPCHGLDLSPETAPAARFTLQDVLLRVFGEANGRLARPRQEDGTAMISVRSAVTLPARQALTSRPTRASGAAPPRPTRSRSQGKVWPGPQPPHLGRRLALSLSRRGWPQQTAGLWLDTGEAEGSSALAELQPGAQVAPTSGALATAAFASTVGWPIGLNGWRLPLQAAAQRS